MLRAGTVGALMLTCASCDQYEFGQQTKDFVENDAYAYSKRLVESDLKNRWANFFNVALVDIGLTLDNVSKDVVNVLGVAQSSTGLNERAAVAQLIFHDRSIDVIRRDQDAIERALSRSSSLSTVCENHDVFESLGISSLALIGQLESLKIPDLNWTVYLGISTSTDSQSAANPSKSDGGNGYFWATVLDSFMSLFQAGQYQHQQDLFHDAVAEYPAKVVQSAELFSMSQQICKSALEQQGNNVSAARDALESYKQLNSKIESAVAIMKQADLAYLSPSRIATALKANGVLQQFDEWRSQVLAGRISRDIALASTELRELQAQALNESDCLVALNSVDELQDAVIETKASLNALLPSVESDELRDRIDTRLAKLQEFPHVYTTLIEPKVKQKCRKVGPHHGQTRGVPPASADRILTAPDPLFPTIALTDIRSPANAIPFRTQPPSHPNGYSPEELCGVLGTNAAAACKKAQKSGIGYSTLCIYGDFCVSDFPALHAARTVLPAFSAFFRRDRQLRSEYGVCDAQQSEHPSYVIYYRGPDTGPPSNVKTALGVPGYVLGNILRDGGYASDARQVQDELNAFRKNIDQRVQHMNELANETRQRLSNFVPKFSATLQEHRAFIDPQVSMLDQETAHLQAQKELAESEAQNSAAALASSYSNRLLNGLSPKKIEEQVNQDVPDANLRSEGPSIVNVGRDLRNERFSSSARHRRDIQREARKARAVFTGGGLPRAQYEIDAARVYGYGKLKAALEFAEAGQLTTSERYLEDARSARYFVQGLIGGVVNVVTVDGNGEQLTFTNDPRTMAGSIWSAFLTARQLDRDAELGDFGVPNISLTFSGVPKKLAVRTIPVPAPVLPNGDSVDENIRQTVLYVIGEAVFAQDPGVLTGTTFPIRKLLWFRDQVRQHGRWDYKRLDTKNPQFDYDGNFNYGATGAALGLPLEGLLRAAGMEKLRNRRGAGPENGTPSGDWPYGNEPDKQRAIEDGYVYYLQHKAYWDKLRFAWPRRNH
ncbi:MAG: polymorphic toxin type 44 domain-containing protein [Steroidobacteraceae bacterium]